MPKIARVIHVVDTVSEWSAKVVCHLAFVLIATTTFEVVSRYVFNSPTSWAVELATFLFAGLWLFSSGYVELHDAHIRADVIYSRFSPRTKAIIDAATFPLFLITVGTVIWVTWDYAMLSVADLERSSSSWHPPIYIIKTLIPIGSSMLFVQGLATFIRNLYLAFYNRRLS